MNFIRCDLLIFAIHVNQPCFEDCRWSKILSKAVATKKKFSKSALCCVCVSDGGICLSPQGHVRWVASADSATPRPYQDVRHLAGPRGHAQQKRSRQKNTVMSNERETSLFAALQSRISRSCLPRNDVTIFLKWLPVV